MIAFSWTRYALAASGALALLACSGPTADTEATSSSASEISRDAGTFKITVYTLAKESEYRGESDFLCRGVAMQGTGIRNDGRYVRYLSGGGGWCGATLCNCASARFGDSDGVYGASGRKLTKHYSIAVDPGTIPLGSYVWIAAANHWFRADDTGGLIRGAHIDVYIADDRKPLAESSRVFVTSEPHDADDPGPSGETASGPAPGGGGEATPPPVTITERPGENGFHALDVRHPVGEGGYVTQCNESKDGERVWLTTASGKDDASRWATPEYPQQIRESCGNARDGIYPLVFRSEEAGAYGAAWITQCTGAGGVARVFKVGSEVDGHPAAAFQYHEQDPGCP